MSIAPIKKNIWLNIIGVNTSIKNEGDSTFKNSDSWYLNKKTINENKMKTKDNPYKSDKK